MAGAETEDQVALRRGTARFRRGAWLGRSGQRRQPRLCRLFGRQFDRRDLPAQPLHIRIGIAPEPASQMPQRLGNLLPDFADCLLRDDKLRLAEGGAAGEAEPQREQHQVDVEPAAILQRQQSLSVIRVRVELYRETPERLGRYERRLASRRHMPAATAPPAYAMLRRLSHQPAMDLDTEALKAKLAALKTEHRDLDDVIARIIERAPFDQLQLQRLKKRKLMLKDQISKIESELLPDIIA